MKRFLKTILSTTTFLIVSIIMVIAGFTLDILVWLKVIAKEEPPLVVHLSTAALYFSGYGNVIMSIVNKRVKDGK